MRAQIPENRLAAPTYTEKSSHEPGEKTEPLQPLLDLAVSSDYLVAGSIGMVAAGDQEYSIPRFIFMGPKGGGDTIRLGLFATLQRDEPEGAEALARFFQELERTPEAAKGFHIYAYPVCDPIGLAAGSESGATGRGLVGEFWRKSRRPEVYYLEREMGVHGFQGVISLHTARETGRFLALCRSSILDAALAQPAVEAARKIDPGSGSRPAGPDGSIPVGFLTATDELRPAPFELNFGIPRQLPAASRIRGTVAALLSIIDSYRTLMTLRQHL